MDGSAPKRRKISRVKTSQTDESETAVKEPAKFIEIPGIIQRITLKNVSCHETLDFDGFTPHINLLQGSNGSGKSSIVAAIIAGLGGLSKSTDKGSSMKNLIQNGKQSATIEIHLRNTGPLCYKGSLYGEKIIVERKLQSSGGGSYKIKSEKGQVISTKKDDLIRILDWFNFQVDNPVLILSQERAKSFLSSTNPHELFKFFMAATQLQQWKEEYDLIVQTNNSSRILVQHKMDSLPVLANEVKEWEKKVQAINSLEGKRQRLSFLRKARAWCEVVEIEEKISENKSKISKIQKNLEKINSTLKDANSNAKETDEKWAKLNQDMEELAQKCKAAEVQRMSASSEWNEAKKICREYLNEKKNFERQLSEVARDVTTLKEKLDKDNNAAQQQWSAVMSKLEMEKSNLQKAIDQLKQQFDTEKTHSLNLNQNFSEAKEDYEHSTLEEKAIRGRVETLKRELRNLEGQENNLCVFGKFMPQVIREIEIGVSRKMFAHKPVGPLGAHIKVKNKDWVHIAEKVIGRLLSSFIVSCRDDYNKLENIFRKTIPKGFPKPQVIVSRFRDQVHDTRQFETVSDRFFSLWSILETDDVQVANTLLDQLQVESILLIPTSDAAGKLLKDQHSVPKNCKKAFTLYGDTYFPDPNYRVYSGTGDKKVQYLQVSVQDKIKDLQINIRMTTDEVDNCKQEINVKKQRYIDLNKEIRDSQRKQQAYTAQMQEYLQQFQNLKDKELPPPPDVCQLQNDLKENEALLDKAREKVDKIKEKLKTAESDMKLKESTKAEALDECNKLETNIKEMEEYSRKIKAKVIQIKKEKIAYSNSKEEIVTKLKELNSSSVEMEKECQEKIKVVTSVDPERITTKSTKKEIDRELLALESAIEREQSRHGDLEAISASWRQKKEKYEAIKIEVESQSAFLTKMKESLVSRKMLYKTAGKLISIMCRSSFKRLISKRNLVGQLDINYKEKALSIMMCKDENASNQLQSLQMMSGGERSFATVSFILALWEIVCSPVRIMDEFDIFMDVVSRTQCLEMIISAAIPSIQYIMVSPLEYRKKSDKLTVFRMPAPKRKCQDEEEE